MLLVSVFFFFFSIRSCCAALIGLWRADKAVVRDRPTQSKLPDWTETKIRQPRWESEVIYSLGKFNVS